MGRCQKVHKFDFQSQLSMSKIIGIFLHFFFFKKIPIYEHVFCYWHFLRTSITKSLYFKNDAHVLTARVSIWFANAWMVEGLTIGGGWAYSAPLSLTKYGVGVVCPLPPGSAIPDRKLQKPKTVCMVLNPNWHAGWYFYLLVLSGSDFVSWILIKNFQTSLEVKIDIKWVNMTPCQAHWVL